MWACAPHHTHGTLSPHSTHCTLTRVERLAPHHAAHPSVEPVDEHQLRLHCSSSRGSSGAAGVGGRELGLWDREGYSKWAPESPPGQASQPAPAGRPALTRRDAAHCLQVGQRHAPQPVHHEDPASKHEAGAGGRAEQKSEIKSSHTHPYPLLASIHPPTHQHWLAGPRTAGRRTVGRRRGRWPRGPPPSARGRRQRRRGAAPPSGSRPPPASTRGCRPRRLREAYITYPHSGVGSGWGGWGGCGGWGAAVR